jgi:hypothetical protein
LLEGTIYNWD